MTPKRPVGRPPTGRGRGSPQVVLRLKPEHYEALQAHAAATGQSGAWLVIEAAAKAGLFKTPRKRSTLSPIDLARANALALLEATPFAQKQSRALKAAVKRYVKP